MPSQLTIISLLLVSLSISDAEVEFTHSTLYGLYDFQGVEEIPLPRCDCGCLIFASTGRYLDNHNGLDPYMKNLIINDSLQDVNVSIAELAIKFEPGSSQKIPLEFTANGNYSILNLNDYKAKGSDVTVWVIESSKAADIDYEVYDAIQMTRVPAIPKDVITIMSANQFTIVAQPGEDNSYTARLVGFDNAFENNPDECVHAYRTPINSQFEGFEFYVDGPLISLAFANRKKVDLTGHFSNSLVSIRSLSNPGFVATSGFSLCGRLGGNQLYHPAFYHTNDEIEWTGLSTDYYQVFLDAYVDLDSTHEIDVTDKSLGGGTIFANLTGARTNTPVIIPRTQTLFISYSDLIAPQTFLIRHSAVLVEQASSPGPSTTMLSVHPTTSLSLPPSSLTISTTFIPTTTSLATGLTALTTAATMLMLILY